MKKLIMSLIISLTVCYIAAQEITTTAGDEFLQPGFSLNFTIGEPVSETFPVGNYFLSQGFQQSSEYGRIQWVNVIPGWSGISGYIELYSNNLDYLFEDHQNDLIVLSNFNGMYFPSQGINTLFSWDFGSGYQVKAIDEFELRLRGWENENTSLELDAGWHILPVLSACNVAVDGGLGGNIYIKIVKEIAGYKIFWPEYGINTIGDLLPGKAYYILLFYNSNLTFPECDTKGTKEINKSAKDVNLTYWNHPSPSAQSHLIMISANVIASMKMESGDFIGGFTSSGSCAGIIQISNLYENHCLTLFADDPLTSEIDGFIEEEPISLRHFHLKEYKESVIEINFDSDFPNQGFFFSHGVSALNEENLSIGSVENTSKLDFSLYPNPARSEVTISWNSEKPEQTFLLIYNAFGQLVKETKIAPSHAGKQQLLLDVSHLGPGTYSVNLKTFCKSGVKKLILVI